MRSAIAKLVRIYLIAANELKNNLCKICTSFRKRKTIFLVPFKTKMWAICPSHTLPQPQNGFDVCLLFNKTDFMSWVFYDQTLLCPQERQSHKIQLLFSSSWSLSLSEPAISHSRYPLHFFLTYSGWPDRRFFFDLTSRFFRSCLADDWRMPKAGYRWRGKRLTLDRAGIYSVRKRCIGGNIFCSTAPEPLENIWSK